MKDGPDIAHIAALIGDPARANMLTALMGGMALTATELSAEAGVTKQTASSHLSKLEAGGLLTIRKQGRHRYYQLADTDVAELLESLMGVAMRAGHVRTRPGPKDPAMRHARVCYDHLAGDMGIRLYESLLKRGHLAEQAGEPALTVAGRDFVTGLGLRLDALEATRRPLCKACLDWSERRTHLAGSLGAALLDHMYASGWAKRKPDSREVVFSKSGKEAFERSFG
ncbi:MULTISPECIES: winged helix-turn-helix domain-containing protein [Kordiimonas]|jgi:DNA-binding transcriptional ArsR family regulator|uniref:winged helix-turn-helix domain-containing protein n=1 Tax=Kordiimonas TaxID=288021 RepID=UPI0025811311|nr:winged helix-turn-helix domain-containing protein [Kordiimonas sp. UBA4487]